MRFVWIEEKGPGFEDACSVRRLVFVQEQGFSSEGEFDHVDTAAWHVIGYEGDTPVATGRLFDTGPGEVHFGRIAVLANQRGKGTGLALLREMGQRARSLGATTVLLSAQADKAGFYRRAGFCETGATSLDEGVPHVEMQARL